MIQYPTVPRLLHRLLPASALLTLLTLLPVAFAQSGRGAIVGRIFNPASGEYVRNASVRIADGESVASGDGGYYRISGLQPGQVTVVVQYSGYQTSSAVVQVMPGQTVTQDFELEILKADTVRLKAFVVSSEREGNAKAIMEQRNSMNITNSVASDVFGDVAEGNIGEFLKHLPGVDGDINDGTMRYIRLRGLPSEYTSVTIDGVSLASADANVGSAANARAFSFEQASLSSMESIEVSKTVSADVDANAPAGTINLKTKRAFDRRGRRVSAQANFSITSWEFDFDKSIGPDDIRRRKALPGGIFEYSDVFLNNRLGVILNINESNFYSLRTPTTMAHNYAATAADPRPVVLTQVQTTHNSRTSERYTTTLTADFKATSNLVLSFSFVYNTSDLWSMQRTVQFTSVNRANSISPDSLTHFTTNASGRVNVAPQAIAKLGKTFTYLPKFEYRRGDFVLDGRFVSSTSESTYDPPGRRASVLSAGSMSLDGVRFEATRSSLHDADWTIRQIGGPDWNSGSRFTTPAVIADDGRFARMRVLSGEVSASHKTNVLLPVAWKAGIKAKRENRRFELTRDSFLYNYTGPGAGVGAWQNLRSPYEMGFGPQNLSITSSGGGTVFMPNLLAVREAFQSRPQDFTQTMSATNFYNAYVANKKNYQEDIAASYLMGTAAWRRTTFRAGIRWENTETDSLEFDALSSDQVRAAGFPVSAGRATTIPGIDYQYRSRPRVHRMGEYDYFFPSASIKHRIRDNFDFHLGYSKTIRRPSFNNVAGVWTINDDTLTVVAPNPALRPELSHNLSARLAYYFEPVGILAVNFFQNMVKGAHRTNQLTAQEFGYSGDLDLSDYLFTTTTGSEGRTRVRGMELEYSQSLSFLPRPFSGLHARASYTRNYAQVITPNMAPHLVTGGLSYAWGRANLSANMNWSADAFTNTAGTSFQRHRVNLDAAGGFRFSPRYSLFVSIRNVLNTPHIVMQRMRDSPAVATMYQIFGTTWVFGVKGTF